MSTVTSESARLRAAIAAGRDALDEILTRYAAINRDWSAVGRGDATASSDVDLLVDLRPSGGNELLRFAGIVEDLSQLLGHRLDVVAPTPFRAEVSVTALADGVTVVSRSDHSTVCRHRRRRRAVPSARSLPARP